MAGTSADEFDAESLGELLDAARSRYGEAFSAVLSRAAVWVNAEEPEAGPDTALAAEDEVAILPPVSGG